MSEEVVEEYVPKDDAKELAKSKIESTLYSLLNMEIVPVETEVTEVKVDDFDYNFKLRMEIARLPEAIQERVRETGGRYLEIGKPAKGFTCHHVVPYFSCIKFRDIANNDEDLDKALEYEKLACTSDNIIELPYRLHKNLHNLTFKTLDELYVEDEEGRKYIPVENMAEYLFGMLSAFERLHHKCHNIYDDLEVYLKEYALKTLEYVPEFCDDSRVKVLANVLANDLADMTDAFQISESIRKMVRYIRLNYL